MYAGPMQHYVEEDLMRLGRAGAVDAMRAFLRATAEGQTAAPPRVNVPVMGRQLVFTIGGSAAQDVAGFRLYSIDREAGTHPESQLLGLLRLSDGKVLATAQGSAFGAWRTAALGAVAMDAATRHVEHPLEVAVLGAGFQAYHHARTWAATRPVARLRVWARRPEAAGAFCDALADDVDCPVEACVASEDAAAGAEAVLCVTASAEPVVAADALSGAAYAATVGPKFGSRHELPAGAYAGADVLLSDAPAQCANFEQDKGPLPAGRTASEMVALADVVAGRAHLPTAGRVLFVSEGLAGSEVALLGALHASS